MSTNCQSCGMPISAETRNAASGDFCSYCADESGNLFPAEQVKAGIAQWLQSFAPPVSTEAMAIRADHYMKSMPAWAEK